MSSFNRVILLGNVTRDIELKYTQSGTAVAELGLAVNEKWKDKKTGKVTDEATFVEVTLWGRTAEIATEYLEKGSPVLVEGKLKLHTWESDGQRRSKLKVTGETLQLLGGQGGNRGGSKPSGGSQQKQNNANSAPQEDDIPF